MNSIEHRILDFLVSDRGWQPTDETKVLECSLLDESVLDSLAIIALVAFIEREYRVQVPEDALLPENFENIARIAKMITDMQAAAAR